MGPDLENSRSQTEAILSECDFYAYPVLGLTQKGECMASVIKLAA